MSHSKYPDAKTWKFYAVHRVGVFDDFDQCQAATKKNDLGYSNKFKGFESFENACVFVNIKDAAEAVRYGSGNCGVKTVTKDKSKGKKKATVVSTPPSTKGALFVAPSLAAYLQTVAPPSSASSSVAGTASEQESPVKRHRSCRTKDISAASNRYDQPRQFIGVSKEQDTQGKGKEEAEVAEVGEEVSSPDFSPEKSPPTKRKLKKSLKEYDSLFFSDTINDCRDVLLKAAIPEAQARLDRQETGALNANKLSRLLILKAKTCSKASLANAFKKLESLGQDIDIRDFIQEFKLLLIQQDQGLWVSVEEARSRLRDENTRITVRAERAEKALQAFKEAKADADEITCSICNETLESRPTTYVTCGFCEDTLNQSLVEDNSKTVPEPFKSWGPAPTSKSDKEEAENSEKEISAAQKQYLIEDLLSSVTSGNSNINWGDILKKSVTKPEDFGAAEESEKPKKKKKGKKTKKNKKTKTAAAEEGSSDVNNNPQ